MLRIALLSLLLCLALSQSAMAADTVVVLVRHAEKATDHPRDPSLSAAGVLRARTLAEALAQLRIQAIYITAYQRTALTAAPLASRVGIEPVVLAAGVDIDAEAQALAARVRGEHRGQSVLVVGHSNTVPALVRALSGHTPSAIAEDEYDRLTVVILSDDSEVRVLQTRY